MGGKKKGLSLEEKRQKLLEVYYEKVSISLLFNLTLERSAQPEGNRKVGTEKGHRSLDSQGRESVPH